MRHRLTYLSLLGITSWSERKSLNKNLMALPLFSETSQVGVIFLDAITHPPEKSFKLIQAIVKAIGYSTRIHEPCDLSMQPSFSIVITFGQNAGEYAVQSLVGAQHFGLSSCEELLQNSNLKREAWNLLKINSNTDFFN